MTSTREAERHHLLDAVLEKMFRVTGHLGSACSACPQVLPSLKIWRHQPNANLSVATSSYIGIFLRGCCTLSGAPALCMLDLHKMSSGLASCRRCNAVASRLHMVHLHCSVAASLAQAA